MKAMLLRLSDNATLSSRATLDAIQRGVADGGICWVPFLGPAPAAERHAEYPRVLVAAKGDVEIVLDIHALVRASARGDEIAARGDVTYLPSEFASVVANAWIKVSAAAELPSRRIRYENDPPLGQGVNYGVLDVESGVWRRTDGGARPAPRPERVLASGPGVVLDLRNLRKLAVRAPLQVLGVDLTASSEKASAAMILEVSADGAVTWSAPSAPLYSDDDVCALIASRAWDCVALDGPRGAPRGWPGFLDKGEEAGTAVRSRACERAVHERIGSIFFFSPRARRGVREWLERSTSLFGRLATAGVNLIEVFPHASFVALVNGTDRRRTNPLRPKDTAGGQADRTAILDAVLGGARDIAAVQGNAEPHDILDAAVAAATAAFHVSGASVSLGNAEDGGEIVVPSARS